MDNLDELYNDIIMEHSMNSYNKKKLDGADFSEVGHNPNCGDEITLEMKLDGNVISDMAFSGHGCAISQASTSVMIDTLRGKTIEEAKQEIGMTIESIDNIRTAYKLSQKYEVEMPIVNAVYKVLFEGLDAKQAILDLMTRNPKFED